MASEVLRKTGLPENSRSVLPVGGLELKIETAATRWAELRKVSTPKPPVISLHGAAPVSHQKRRERSATNAIEFKRKHSKISETDRYSAAHNGPVAGLVRWPAREISRLSQHRSGSPHQILLGLLLPFVSYSLRTDRTGPIPLHTSRICYAPPSPLVVRVRPRPIRVRPKRGTSQSIGSGSTDDRAPWHVERTSCGLRRMRVAFSL